MGRVYAGMLKKPLPESPTYRITLYYQESLRLSLDRSTHRLFASPCNSYLPRFEVGNEYSILYVS